MCLRLSTAFPFVLVFFSRFKHRPFLRMAARKKLAQVYVLSTALSLLLLSLQVQNSSESEEEREVQEYFGLAWCGSRTATTSRDQRRKVDPAFEIVLQNLAGLS